MHLEGIILSEISQTEKRQTLYDLTYMWNPNIKAKSEKNGDYQGLAGGGMFEGTNLQLRDKSWGTNTQACDYRQPNCIININFAKRLDLNCS